MSKKNVILTMEKARIFRIESGTKSSMLFNQRLFVFSVPISFMEILVDLAMHFCSTDSAQPCLLTGTGAHCRFYCTGDSQLFIWKIALYVIYRVCPKSIIVGKE